MSFLKKDLILSIVAFTFFAPITAKSQSCGQILKNTSARLSSAVTRKAETDTTNIRFYMLADQKGIETLSSEQGFGFPSGEVDINPVVDKAVDSASLMVSAGERNLFLTSESSWPAIKVLIQENSSTYPQDVVLVFPYGYLVRARLHKRSFVFLTGKSKLYVNDFTPITRGNWDESRPPKKDTSDLKDSKNNIFIAQRAKAQVEFSNTFVSGSAQDQIGVFEAQRKLFETLVLLLEENRGLNSPLLARLNTQVGQYVSTVETYYDSDVAPFPFDGYTSEFAQAPEAISALAGIYRGSYIESDLLSTMGQAEVALLNYLLPRHVTEETRQLIHFINSLNESSDLSFVAFAYKTFLSIHPFANGNGRMSRALLDYMLIKIGYEPPVSYDENLAWVHWQSVEELTYKLSESLSE